MCFDKTKTLGIGILFLVTALSVMSQAGSLADFLEHYERPDWWSSESCFPRASSIYFQGKEYGLDMYMVALSSPNIGHSIAAAKKGNRFIFIESVFYPLRTSYCVAGRANKKTNKKCLDRWVGAVWIKIHTNLTFGYGEDGIPSYYYADEILSQNLPFSNIPGDRNKDTYVSDNELLDYIDLWANGLVEDFDLLTAIEYWAEA